MASKNWTGSVGTLLKVSDGFALGDVDPDSTPGYDGGKKQGEKDLKAGGVILGDLQERMFASRKSAPASVLLVLQAMDSAGKGGIVSHVVGADTNAEAVMITAFKAPTDEEKAHDFLWRVRPRLPQPGYIGVFDRSHYEEVLIAKVRSLSTPEQIEERYGIIKDFENEVVASGTRIIKVMLHISYDEQRDRLMDRLDRVDKQWKFNPGDVDERMLWPHYMDAFQTAVTRTSTDDAPWYVVPGNKKWYARLAVQRLIIDALKGIDPQWPAPDYDVEEQKKRLKAT